MIRYFQEEDKKLFANELLRDSEARKYMNLIGASEWDILKPESNRWSAAFVIETENNPAGFIKISYHAAECRVSIDELFIIECWRGRKFASELMDFAVDFAYSSWPETKGIYSFTQDGSPAEKYKGKKGWKLMGNYKKFTRNMDQKYWVYERVKQ